MQQRNILLLLKKSVENCSVAGWLCQKIC